MSTLDVALKYLGYEERTHRRQLMDAFKAVGISIDPATTPWCAAFVNLVERRLGRRGTGKLNARSFLDYGEKVKDPKPGDILIFTRGNSSWQGHVTFYVATEGSNYMCLGGNQGDKVCYRLYPKHSLLGIRRPKEITTKTPTFTNGI